MSTYEHGQVWINPRGEYVVLMSYDFHAQQEYMTNGEYLAMRISHNLTDWLRQFGPEVTNSMDDTSDTFPWRRRSFVPGSEGLHAFFFYRRRPAILFKLRWT